MTPSNEPIALADYIVVVLAVRPSLAQYPAFERLGWAITVGAVLFAGLANSFGR